MPPETPTPAFVLGILAIFCWIVSAQFGLAYRLLTGRGLWAEELPKPVRYNARGLLAVLLFWMMAQQVVSILIPRTQGQPTPPRVLMLATALVNAVTLLAGPWVLARGSKIDRSELDLLGPRPGDRFRMGVRTWPIISLWVYVVFYGAILVWGTTKHPVEEWVRTDRAPLSIFLSTLTAVVIAPAAEEFLFRGILLGVLMRRVLPREEEPEVLEESAGEPVELSPKPVERKPWLGLWGCNLLVSVLFAALHGPIWPTPIPLFLLSLALGVLYQRTGGIAAPIGLHMTFNGITTLMMNLMLISGVPGGEAPKQPKAAPVPPAVQRDVDPKQPAVSKKSLENEIPAGIPRTN